MYTIKLALTEEEILEFENLRNRVFKGTKPIEKKTQSPYAQAIEEGDLLAFQCLEEGELVGGMLIGLARNKIELIRIFVESSKREQGAGDFMIKYIDSHREMFEDYYGVESIDGCILTPMISGVDYWCNKGFYLSKNKMYKRYEKKRRK